MRKAGLRRRLGCASAAIVGKQPDDQGRGSHTEQPDQQQDHGDQAKSPAAAGAAPPRSGAISRPIETNQCAGHRCGLGATGSRSWRLDHLHSVSRPASASRADGGSHPTEVQRKDRVADRPALSKSSGLKSAHTTVSQATTSVLVRFPASRSRTPKIPPTRL